MKTETLTLRCDAALVQHLTDLPPPLAQVWLDDNVLLLQRVLEEHLATTLRAFLAADGIDVKETPMSPLPPTAFLDPDNCTRLKPHMAQTRVIRVTVGETGYETVETIHSAATLNTMNGIACDARQASALFHGSMFGWDTAGADPTGYDEHGVPL